MSRGPRRSTLLPYTPHSPSRANPDQHRRQIRALLDRPDARPLLPAITCPTLVLVGRQDRWSPLAQHEEIAALIPNATLVADRKSTRLNSSHANISYAVFCLK